METLIQYRYLIDEKKKEAFLNAFRKAINKIDKNKFGFIGIIGSIKENFSHDIDVLIFPNFNVKLGDALLEYAKLYEETEKELKKYNRRYYLSVCQKFAMEELFNYLSASQEGTAGIIPVHSMFFGNYRDFIRLSPKTFVKNVKKTLITLHGNLEQMKKLPALPQKTLEPYFFVLDFEMSSRIKNFPRQLIRASAESLFEYLKKRYNIEINEKAPHDVGIISKKFKKLLRRIDEKTYST